MEKLEQEIIEEEVTKEEVSEEQSKIIIAFGGNDDSINISIPSGMPIINVLGMLEYTKDIIISNEKEKFELGNKNDM